MCVREPGSGPGWLPGPGPQWRAGTFSACQGGPAGHSRCPHRAGKVALRARDSLSRCFVRALLPGPLLGFKPPARTRCALRPSQPRAMPQRSATFSAGPDSRRPLPSAGPGVTRGFPAGPGAERQVLSRREGSFANFAELSSADYLAAAGLRARSPAELRRGVPLRAAPVPGVPAAIPGAEPPARVVPAFAEADVSAQHMGRAAFGLEFSPLELASSRELVNLSFC